VASKITDESKTSRGDCNQLILKKSGDDPKICNYPKKNKLHDEVRVKHQDFSFKSCSHDDDGLCHNFLVGKSGKSGSFTTFHCFFGEHPNFLYV